MCSQAHESNHRPVLSPFLQIIAASFGVTVQSIVDLNGLANPDAIQAGQTIEIPSGIVVVEDLPAAPESTAAE